MFSAVISEHFSQNRMIIFVVAAKIWYLKKCAVFIGPPCTFNVALSSGKQFTRWRHSIINKLSKLAYYRHVQYAMHWR